MPKKTVIRLEELSLSQADTESVLGAAGTNIVFSHHLPCVPEEKVVVERSEESLGGVPEELVFRDRGVVDEEAATEADIEDEDVDVFCGALALAISGFESKGFTFSEVVRKKRLQGQSVSGRVVDTSRLRQCEFSNTQNIPVTFYFLNLLASLSINSVTSVMPSAMKPEDDFKRQLCFNV